MKGCPICKRPTEVVPTNNPLYPGICLECLQELVDYRDLNQVDFFCRTYNIPFLPEKWLRIAEEAKGETFIFYVDVIKNEYPKTLYNGETASELWSKVNKEWLKCASLNDAIQAIAPIKENFIKRMQLKWGVEYSFEDYIQLEFLYTNTAQSSGTTNPLTLDIIRKIAIISVEMEKALTEKNIKAAAEFSKMHKQLIDAAGISDMIEVGETDTIATLSELCDYVESQGFQLKFYDGVARDVVDKTILDQQEWTRKFFETNTGIVQDYQLIEETYQNKLEKEKSGEAYDELSLEALLEDTKKGMGAFGAEIESDDTSDLDIGDINDPNF